MIILEQGPPFKLKPVFFKAKFGDDNKNCFRLVFLWWGIAWYPVDFYGFCNYVANGKTAWFTDSSLTKIKQYNK